MKPLPVLIALFFVWSCSQKTEKTSMYSEALTQRPEWNIEQAFRLSQLPLHCIQTQYPNKPNYTLLSLNDLQEPQSIHPAFYGCFDWHSSVHGHWSIVALLKEFPNLENQEELRAILTNSLTKEHIQQELAYFQQEEHRSFERTYGWAWLLKLAEELHTWNDPMAVELENNVRPLAEQISDLYLDFLPKLYYPNRTGEHPNTAFGLSFAYDYAITVGDTELSQLIELRSRDFYFTDKQCPISWEPSGFDFLSPCVEEIDIMRKVLPMEEFEAWLEEFLPELTDKEFQWEVGVVSDRSDGKLVHLDGLNFSRAWCLYGLANEYPKWEHLRAIANAHVNSSLPAIVDEHYEGTHWLGSFAIYALLQSKSKE